jgi:hypothetical protein
MRGDGIAKYSVFSADALIDIIMKMAQLPEELKKKMQNEGLAEVGELFKKRLREALATRKYRHVHGVDDLVDTGKLSESIKYKVAAGYVDIYPQGGRPVKRSGKKSGKPNKGASQRNQTVGFVLEYGRSDMPAHRWMSTAADATADEATALVVQELDKLLSQI